MPRESPDVWRRRLGNELRKFREGAGLTIHDVATGLECSSSKISRIETAKVGATPRDVRDMLELYRVSSDQRDELVQLAREARQKDPLLAFRDLPFVALVGLEQAAASLRMYSVLNIPGHLQTREYAQAVIRAIWPKLPDKEVDRRVELRMKRHEFLTQDSPGSFWVVLDEAVLHRPIGGTEVMRRQIQRLIELARLDNVVMQVLPFSVGAHAAMDGEFTIVSFRNPADPDTVFIENTTYDLYLEDPDALRRYNALFDDLRVAALGTPESLEFLIEKGETILTMDTPPTSFWKKSTRSGANGCVEVLVDRRQISVRDSKDQLGPVLTFTPVEWEAFIGGVRDGEFDLPG